MNSNDTPVTEQELIDRSAGERVTLAQVNDAIVSEHYFTAADGVYGHAVTTGAGYNLNAHPDLAVLTFCVLRLWNGFTVTGESACADPANFDANIGRRIARDNAVKKIWPLMGFELKCRLAREKQLLASKAFDSYRPTYIGTKVIHAEPMSRAEYNKLRGWTLPADENGFDEGYLVEYADRVESPPHVHGFKGYVSWSPKEVFERAYKLAGKYRQEPIAHVSV